MPELKVKQVVRRLAEAKERSNPEYGYAIIRLGVKKEISRVLGGYNG